MAAQAGDKGKERQGHRQLPQKFAVSNRDGGMPLASVSTAFLGEGDKVLRPCLLNYSVLTR